MLFLESYHASLTSILDSSESSIKRMLLRYLLRAIVRDSSVGWRELSCILIGKNPRVRLDELRAALGIMVGEVPVDEFKRAGKAELGDVEDR